MENLLQITAHRPWPVPNRVWLMKQTWNDLLFAHWPIDPDLIRPYVPERLRIDTFQGTAWLGIVPFHVSGLRLRGVPPIPGASRFAEINVRTYVSSGEKPGVWFFSLDATNPLVVWGARWAFYLPYFRAHIRHIHESGWTHYSVARIDRAALPANLKMYYRGMGNVFNAIQGTFEHFAYERYCLYTTNKDNHLIRCEIHHAPWPLQRSEAIIKHNTMAKGSGIPMSGTGSPVLHFTQIQHVLIWRPEPIVS